MCQWQSEKCLTNNFLWSLKKENFSAKRQLWNLIINMNRGWLVDCILSIYFAILFPSLCIYIMSSSCLLESESNLHFLKPMNIFLTIFSPTLLLIMKQQSECSHWSFSITLLHINKRAVKIKPASSRDQHCCYMIRGYSQICERFSQPNNACVLIFKT